MVDTDLFIMVTAKNEPKEGFVAWAMPCALSSFTGRPIIGHINFNVFSIDLTPTKF